MKMITDNKVGSLVEGTLKRKEILRNLKRKNDNDQEKVDASKPSAPKFRNYKPSDDTLKDKALEDAKPGDVENVVEDQLKAATTKPGIEELDITNLAPRKPDWDLQRDNGKN